mgnify:CR=1 FL=1|tara:strand:+ start:532 stop:1464 length:933 start_codon:yes stop_codon:yes gene_type:complete
MSTARFAFTFLLVGACSGLTSLATVRPLRRVPTLPRATVPACSDTQSPEDHALSAPQQLEQRWLRPVPLAATVLGALFVCSPSAAHAAAALTTGLTDTSFSATFLQSSSLILVSEIGDKTFFIAALLAARTSRLLTFAGCAGALVIMTVISVAIGQIFHAVPASLTRGLPIDDYVAVASFLYFGVKSLLDARAIEGDDNSGIAEEREDAEKTLEESGVSLKGGWPLVVEALTLTTVAEIGDRSQIATIALSAAGNPYFVCLGAIAGHFVATGAAVVGGKYLSQFLSEKGILIVGGVLFLVFALTTALGVF